jgi:translation elongation factor EF-4
MQEGLKIIPVINKIDMISANVESVELAMIE